MKPSRTNIFIIFLLTFGLPFKGYALSCAPMHDRIIAKCSEGTCAELLYVREVTGPSACSRRPTFEAAPDWASRVMEFEVAKLNSSKEETLYELVLESRYWSGEYIFSNADEYIQLVNDEARGKQFYREINTISDKSMSELKEEWTAKIRSAYIEMVLWKVADWLSLGISLVFLVISILWFNQWIIGSKGLKWLLLSLVGQSTIMALAVMSVINVSNFLILFVGFLIPGVWFYQIIHYIISVWGRKSHLIKQS